MKLCKVLLLVSIVGASQLQSMVVYRDCWAPLQPSLPSIIATAPSPYPGQTFFSISPMNPHAMMSAQNCLVAGRTTQYKKLTELSYAADSLRRFEQVGSVLDQELFACVDELLRVLLNDHEFEHLLHLHDFVFLRRYEDSDELLHARTVINTQWRAVVSNVMNYLYTIDEGLIVERNSLSETTQKYAYTKCGAFIKQIYNDQECRDLIERINKNGNHHASRILESCWLPRRVFGWIQCNTYKIVDSDHYRRLQQIHQLCVQRNYAQAEHAIYKTVRVEQKLVAACKRRYPPVQQQPPTPIQPIAQPQQSFLTPYAHKSLTSLEREQIERYNNNRDVALTCNRISDALYATESASHIAFYFGMLDTTCTVYEIKHANSFNEAQTLFCELHNHESSQYTNRLNRIARATCNRLNDLCSPGVIVGGIALGAACATGVIPTWVVVSTTVAYAGIMIFDIVLAHLAQEQLFNDRLSDCVAFLTSPEGIATCDEVTGTAVADLCTVWATNKAAPLAAKLFTHTTLGRKIACAAAVASGKCAGYAQRMKRAANNAASELCDAVVQDCFTLPPKPYVTATVITEHGAEIEIPLLIEEIEQNSFACAQQSDKVKGGRNQKPAPRNHIPHVKLTNKQQKEIATRNKWIDTGRVDEYENHIFKDPRNNWLYSYDLDGHNGGIWKLIDRNFNRIATCNEYGDPFKK